MLITISDFDGNVIKLNKSLINRLFPNACVDINSYEKAMETLGIGSFDKVIDGKIKLHIRK